jgi:hypothetical protein
MPFFASRLFVVLPFIVLFRISVRISTPLFFAKAPMPWPMAKDYKFFAFVLCGLSCLSYILFVLYAFVKYRMPAAAPFPAIPL